MSAEHTKYPPCAHCSCSGNQCGLGYKAEWPELVGADPNVAKAQIEKDNPYVSGVIVPQGVVEVDILCCNRVLIYVGDNGRVKVLPKVG